ncbi:MAG TPA: hypothetical protein VI306_18520 [Pyrinomonadaceae bacterium]
MIADCGLQISDYDSVIIFGFTAKRLRPKAQGCFNPGTTSYNGVTTATRLRLDRDIRTATALRLKLVVAVAKAQRLGFET